MDEPRNWRVSEDKGKWACSVFADGKHVYPLGCAARSADVKKGKRIGTFLNAERLDWALTVPASEASLAASWEPDCKRPGAMARLSAAVRAAEDKSVFDMEGESVGVTTKEELPDTFAVPATLLDEPDAWDAAMAVPQQQEQQKQHKQRSAQSALNAVKADERLQLQQQPVKTEVKAETADRDGIKREPRTSRKAEVPVKKEDEADSSRFKATLLPAKLELTVSDDDCKEEQTLLWECANLVLDISSDEDQEQVATNGAASSSGAQWSGQALPVPAAATMASPVQNRGCNGMQFYYGLRGSRRRRQ